MSDDQGLSAPLLLTTVVIQVPTHRQQWVTVTQGSQGIAIPAFLT